MENLNAEQVTNPNIELYDYVKKIVAAVKYKGDGDHEDVPSILRKFAKGYEQRIKELTEQVADWKATAEGYQKQFEDCAEDRAKFTEENERLNQSCTNLEQECKKWQERFQKILDRISEHATNGHPRKVRLDVVEKIAKELEDG